VLPFQRIAVLLYGAKRPPYRGDLLQEFDCHALFFNLKLRCCGLQPIGQAVFEQVAARAGNRGQQCWLTHRLLDRIRPTRPPLRMVRHRDRGFLRLA
jgi:hypothetical protein